MINNKNNVFQIVNFVDIIHPEHQKDDERNNITRRLHFLVRVNRPSPTPYFLPSILILLQNPAYRLK